MDTTERESPTVEAVRARLGDRVRVDHPVSDQTTYRVGGRAAFFFVAESTADLAAVAELMDRTGLPVVVLGRGSNVLFADTGYDGLVLQLGEFASVMDIPAVMPESGQVEVRIGAAVALPVAARQTAAAGLRGFEWAVGVPGSVGGAVRMNAGGHGSDMARTLLSVEVFDLADAGTRTLVPADVGLRFRGSALSDSDVVLSVVVGLERGSSSEATEEIDEIVRWRRANQPGGQNAGSVFVNPVPGQVSAGELIDGCGLRGFRIGSAHVSSKHANFIQAEPDGTADDVVAVMCHVRDVVAASTGHRLRSEVRLLGFDPTILADLHGDGSHQMSDEVEGRP
ncbi:MAG: UDP-N-acetylmuramate dehydrogenase [Actinomycetota bacterium]